MTDTIADAAAVSTAQIAEHLSLIGYTIEEMEGNYKANHPSQADLRLRSVLGGSLIVTYFGVRQGLAEGLAVQYVNELNQRALVARFLIDKDGDFAMEGWLPAPYDRAAFSAWIDAWQRDFSAVVQHETSASVLV